VAKDDEEVGRYRAQTLTRGLAVLRTMADVREPVTLQDLHDRTGIPKPTLVRLLAILTQEGCTVRLDERPTYGLGPTVTAIAAGVADDLHPEELARPYLQRLSTTVGHTANLGVLAGNQVLHLCVVLANRPIRYIVHTGSRDDPHSTGLGKALLAQLDAATVQRIVGDGPLDAKTDHTITSRSKLDAELKKVRRQGYAYDDQEGALGLSCFAVPVVVGGRPVAALSISGPAGELPPERNETIVPELTAIAGQIAADPRLARALSTITPDPAPAS
jgi:IclR family acetate operon transcriptional repressor